jgi:hypothetical protein
MNAIRGQVPFFIAIPPCVFASGYSGKNLTIRLAD